jgi:hypothetical protein
MRGSVRELVKGKRYELRIALGKDPVTGKYRQKSISVHGTRTEARRALRRILVELEEGGAPLATTRAREPEQRPAHTFGELLDEWIRFKESADRSPTTIDRYRRAIELHLRPSLGVIALCQLTAKDFDDLYRDELTRLKPASVLKNHLVARAALDSAVRWGWLDQNPAARAEPPRVRPPRVRPPTAEELQRLLELAEDTDPTFATFLRVGAATGALDTRRKILGENARAVYRL